MAFDMGTRWAEQGRLDRAVAEYERALRLESSGAVRLDPIDRADLYYDYANTLSRLGRGSDAVTYWERAVRTAPDHALAIHALANARAAAGQTATAESLYDALDGKSGGHLLALDGRAHLAAAQGRLEEAERLFHEIVREAPAQYAAWGALVRVQAEEAKLQEAGRSLAEAGRRGMPAPELHGHEALLAAMAGDRAGAEKALALIPPEAVQRDPELADVVAVTRRLLPAR
jgi:tetratricopeptide (TPR) repeat protein